MISDGAFLCSDRSMKPWPCDYKILKAKVHLYSESLPVTIFWARTANFLLNYNTVFIFSNTEPVTRSLPQTAVYEITRVTKADEGSYSCLARNAAGTTEERLHLTVEENEVPNRGDIPGVYTDQFCLCLVLLALQYEYIDRNILI
jgi:hypothetical protein